MSESSSHPFDAAQALAALLPAALLVWFGPGAPLRDVPTTASTAAGVAALATLIPAALLVARRTPLRARGLVPLLIVITIAELGARTVAVDSFEARRALLTLWTGLALYLCGASLADRGRAVLALGLACLSLALTLPVLTFDGPAGVLGNTGDLSEAALPGALCGLGVFLAGTGFVRVLGLAATLVYAWYVASVPVWTGVVSLGFAIALGIVLSLKHRPLARHARLGLVACLLLALPFGWRAVRADRPAHATPAASALAPPPAGGGVEFRLRTARALPAMVLDHPFVGVGPGQFQAAFPPYRDPAETLVSSLQRREPTPIEVEHAHDDWLEGFAELGLVGGAAWALFLALAGLRALRALFARDVMRQTLGLATVALLTSALANAPLLYGVASAPIAFLVLGALAGGPEGKNEGKNEDDAQRPKRRLAPLLPLACVVLLAVRASAAYDFVRHGAALSRLARITVEMNGETRLRSTRLGPILDDALDACPDSVAALSQRAQLERARDRSGAERLVREQALLLRPWNFEHLVGLGSLHARGKNFGEARRYYDRAGEIDATSPVLLQNRTQLALDSGDSDALIDALAELEREDALEPAWVRRAGAEQLLRGRPGLAHFLLSKLDARYAVHDPNVSYQLAQEHRSAGDKLLADGLLANAQLLFAREHIADRKPEVAIRNYRQSVRVSRDYIEGGAHLVRLEMAAAQVQAEKTEDARTTLEGFEATAAELIELPTWAGQALLDAGLLR
ncbi:MAG: hypothetical protein GY711_14405 [bacterium]|nr:hypothetical protein [bacterium]